MGKQGRKRNAIHSGIGDNDDLFVKRPAKEDVTEDFQYATRLRGKKRHETMIYPELPFEYGVSYTGKTLEVFNEKPYQFGVNAHPAKNIGYRIEETKTLPVNRLWEAKACFEAEVLRYNMKYAINYKGHTGYIDKRTAEYAVKWEGMYTVANLGDLKQYCTTATGDALGDKGYGNWTMQSAYIEDKTNTEKWSGVIAKDNKFKRMNSYDITYKFKPQKANGTGGSQNAHRRAANGSFYKDYGWDDDCIGFIFKAKDKYNFYMLLIEGHERVWKGSRPPDKLDGLTIFGGSSFIDQAIAEGSLLPGSPQPNGGQWNNYVNNVGWRQQHRRIYRVKNGVLQRVCVNNQRPGGTNGYDYGCYDRGNGAGWAMESMQTIKLESAGNNVKLYINGEMSFDFNTEWDTGSFGVMNVSQAVEFHSVNVIEKKKLTGRIPEYGWDTTTEPNKQIAGFAHYYVTESDSFKSKVRADGISPDIVSLTSITGEARSDENGWISIPGHWQAITVGARDYSTWRDHVGRIPATGWFEWDGIGGKEHASNAQQYVKDHIGKSDFVLDNISGVVEDQKTGSVLISYKTGPIIAKNNNAPDAGKVYAKCYVRCGIVEVNPDHKNYETGLVIWYDIADVFKDDYKEFFNRPDYINKKAVYELLRPVKKEPPKPPEEESEGGCELPKPPKPEEPIVQCLNDFDFDGRKLVMWSCEFPIEITTKLFEEKVYAYRGWTTFTPLENFKPNKWTHYKLIPIEATIDPKYDEIKWAGRTMLENAPAGTKVVIRTKEWYKAFFPADIINKGIVNSDADITSEIPPSPEHFWHPSAKDDTDITLRMPDHFDDVQYLIDAWKNHPDVVIYFASNPLLTTDNANRNPEALAQEGVAGMPIVLTTMDTDKIIIHCKEDPRRVPWTSGKYIGYGKLNGKRPFWGNGSGKADMVNVSTEVVFFPENIILDTVQGPFIDIYDKEFPEYPRVKYKLHHENKLIDFTSDFTDAYVWYTDWYSKWVEAEEKYSANMTDITRIDTPLDLDPTNNKVSDDYDPDNTFIEKIEVTSNNPFVKVWIEEDKGKHKGLLGSYYRFPLTSNVYKEEWRVEGDYKEWSQVYEIKSYMTKIEIPIKQASFNIIEVKLDKTVIPKDDNNGWKLDGGTVILKGSAIKPGMLNVRYSTGDINNLFVLEDNKGTHVEVYVNDVLLDPADYSFNKRELTIKKSQLFLHDWVRIQSYEMNDLHDPTKMNYLGEKQYSQLDFQEDVPSSPVNPNYNDPYYEGSFCFNWKYERPVGMQATTKLAADFKPMSMYLPEKVNFKFNVDMELVIPVGKPVDISNFTGEWKQWDQKPLDPPADGRGDWHGPPEAGYTRVTNLINQTYYSGWYDPKHVEITDYEIALTAKSETLWDDDMYGVSFRWNPETMSGYTFEWDAGGAGVNGMAIYKMTCTNPQAIGTDTQLNFSKVRLAYDPTWWDPDGNPGGKEIPNRPLYEHRIKISAIGKQFKVWVDNKLMLRAEDSTYKAGAWGPITRSNPNTFFWDFWMQTYRRATYNEVTAFRQPYEIVKERPLIEGDEPMFEIELDEKSMEKKFDSIITAYCAANNIPKYSLTSIEYYITEDTSDVPVYFREYQTIRVLELTPSVLAQNPKGKTSIQQAVEKFGGFDPSKKIIITQDIYENWQKYKVEDFDVITFTPADCNANFDLVSDEMMSFVREFKLAPEKVVIFTHDTGSSDNKPRFRQLLREFGFRLTTSEPYTRGTVLNRVDNSFNYPYDIKGDVQVSVSHWNQTHNSIPIYKFAHEDRAWLSYIDNVYYSEAGDSLYMCNGTFNQQLSDNEMMIWINLICRIAQWTPSAKPKMTRYGSSKLYATVQGQYPPLGEERETNVPDKDKTEIPDVQPPTESNPNDGFTITWNGYIFAPVSGSYKFRATVNDGFRLWIKGTELISQWHKTGDPNYFPTYEASVYLEGGKWYPIRSNYFDNVGQALVRLHWAQPGKGFQRISPDYLTPYLGYKLYAQVKQAKPLPWSPMIHNGYYYHQEREHYLYAQKSVNKVTPNEFNEVVLYPRPQQGSAIIVRDNEGNNLRKVTFYDENWNLTLENKEEFAGNGYAKYYMNYKGIDKATVKVRVNGTFLYNTEYIFNEEDSSIEFMQEMQFDDIIEVRYILLYSYYLDMNADVVDGFVNRDMAKLKLHSNYEVAKMRNMEVIYEGAKETPYYRATEVMFNPLLNNNHTGFLYITEVQEQVVKDMTINLSENTISDTGKEKVLLTAKVVDNYGNPCPNKLVKISRDGILIGSGYTTNDAGEVYLYDTPTPPAKKMSTYKVECETIIKETLLNYHVDKKNERFYLDVDAQKLSIMASVVDEAVINVVLRDKNWDTVGSGKTVRVEIRDTFGATTTQSLTTDSFGKVQVKVSGKQQQHGNMMVKVSYDMGFEEAANYVHLKVIGG